MAQIYKYIFEYFAEQVFQLGSNSPPQPTQKFSEVLKIPMEGKAVELALIHYLEEQKKYHLFGDLEFNEIVKRSIKFYDTGVFSLEVELLYPDNFVVFLYVWNGTEYVFIQQAIEKYLQETERM